MDLRLEGKLARLGLIKIERDAMQESNFKSSSSSDSQVVYPIIDFHTQVSPPVVSDAVKLIASQAKSHLDQGLMFAQVPAEIREKIDSATENLVSKLRMGWMGARSILKDALVPLARHTHEMQTQTRTLPPLVRDLLDEVGTVSALPHLILESSSTDQLQAMEELGIDCALTVAFPPLVSSDFVIDLAQDDSRRIPVVAFEKKQTVSQVTGLFEQYHASGVRILKIYPLYDGLDADSEFYRVQLKLAEEHGWIVILHTGSVHFKLLMPQTQLGEVTRFESWFSEFPQLNFVLAHMGMHKSREVLDIAKRHANTWVTTSWQPADVIAQAIHILGAERVLYASDWPLFGENMKVGIGRIREIEDNSMITPAEAALVLGGSAAHLLKKVGLQAP